MKVTCQSCQAKYTIADEKVRGKVAKIRCKKCGTTIIVNGTDGAVAAPSDHPVADYTQQGANTEQWTVLVGEGDQRTVTAAEITKLYLGGEISYETPAWKDGMPEWLSISQIDALRSVLDNGPQPTMTPFADQSHAPAASEPPPPDPVVPAMPMNVAAAAPAAKPIGARGRAFEPAAARRPGRGGSTDLFGAPAQDEVLTSASANPVAHDDGGHDKLTGARNENSVLFSLSSLTGAPGGGGGGAAPAPVSIDTSPVSSKADLRSLMGSSDSNGRPAPARSGLDDIMNLGGGGVYSPALMAPALAPPSVDFASAADATAMPGSKPKGKGMLYAIIGVLIVGGAAGFYVMSSKDSDKTSGVGSASPSAAPAPTAEAPKAPEATAEPTAESAPTVLAPGQSAPKPETEKKTAKADRPDKPAAAAPAAIAAAVAPEKPAAAAPEKPAAAAAAPAGGDVDRAAALSSLSAAASAAQSCKKPDGPTGSGRISITFANSGAATTAQVEGPPFAGTPVGGCVAARFRGVHVPPFGGQPVTVHKTFMIN